MKIVFDQPECEKTLQKLRGFNRDLERIRGQLKEIQEPKHSTNTSDCCRRKASQKYGSFGAIRRASKVLHQALATAWSTSNVAQLRHLVRLFVDAAEVEGEVRMDLVILCPSECETYQSFNASLIQLQVRSQITTWLLTPSISPVPSLFSGSSQGPRKRRKVRFLDEASMTEDPAPVVKPLTKVAPLLPICVIRRAFARTSLGNVSSGGPAIAASATSIR